MWINSSVSNIHHVGSDMVTIENDDVLPIWMKAVRQGTTLVRVVEEACVMLIEVILVRYGVELNCCRFFAKL